jgi:PPM family protein phosphatase
MFSRWKKNAAPAPSLDGLGVRVGASSDVGQIRSENQDSFGVWPAEAPRLFAVCDGMGGHESGGTASRVAVDALFSAFDKEPPPLAHRLREAVKHANSAVWNQAGEGSPRRMGTTCTAVAAGEGRVVLAHVGDSRAYRVHPDRLELVSEDHTVAAEMTASGILSAEEAARHPRRNALTRALGTSPEVDVFVRDLGSVSEGMRLLICSDGLLPVGLEEVHRAALSDDLQQAADRLVSRANEVGGPDNITVLIVEIAGDV